MNYKRIPMLIVSVLILLYTLFTQPFAMYGDSEFSTNSNSVKENYNSTFTLSHDATLYFKYASKDLDDDSVITLVNKNTDKTVFSTANLEDIDTFIEEIPKGTYKLSIHYNDGFLTYNLLTRKKKIWFN